MCCSAQTEMANAFTPKDPITHKPFTKLYLMSLKDRGVTPYKGNDAIQALKYHVGPAAMLPDSSGIISKPQQAETQ